MINQDEKLTPQCSESLQYQSSDSDDLFNALINYNGGQDELLSQTASNNYRCNEDNDCNNNYSSSTPTKKSVSLTFLEPNIDLKAKIPLQVNKNHQNTLNDYNCEIIKAMLHHQTYNSIQNEYLLEIIEQPQQCRMSGYGEKDRRPIDPAPIVKLTVLNGSEDNIIDAIDCPFYILHASLWSVDMTTKHDLIEGTTIHSLKLLIGSLVSSPELLRDLENVKAYYFSFPDLSVRMTGQYRLQFSLIHLARNKVIKEVFSDPFIVYTAKAYPGMKESSALSKHLAKQGLKLTVRIQTRSKKDEK